MSTLNNLNSKYVTLIEKIECLQLYLDRVESKKNSLGESLICLKEMISKTNSNEDAQIVDTVAVTEAYVNCVEKINEYKEQLVKDGVDKSAVMKSVEQVVKAQAEFDKAKREYDQKYKYVMDSDKAIKKAIPACIRSVMAIIQEKSDEVMREAKSIIGNEWSVELHKTDEISKPTELPESMLVARIPVGGVSLPLLKDMGIANAYQNMQIDLRKQGNTIIQTTYEQMETEEIDNFILSYVFRYLETFPLGTVNIHIFDQNTSYLYRRLSNSFQSENASEGTKRTVQIHSDLNDLATFRDVNCEDIFKKTSLSTPDLYSIHKTDTTDPFNLIILRDGLVDGSGYASSEALDTICSLSRPGDIGHKCGFRFLIVDNSISFEKSLTSNSKHVISLIQQNCNLKLRFEAGRYFADDTAIDVLQIKDDLDEFVQLRAQSVAEALSNKEQNYVSIDEVSTDGSSELGCIMYIPIGRAGSSVVELPLSCKDENGTVAGQCIGYMAIGQSGSGKSSFFHSLVLNGCMKYSPKNLQFWLLDFKNGGASSKYSQSGLPHIKMIAENNKIDDALCLFQMVLEEMERRSNAFNRNFADNIVDYNKIATEKGLEYFPRIIIAIDEVQEIFRDDNASVLQKLISSISTRMRSAGMHFVMVAQNLSDGKSYMLKDAFLPSATGRICFRVAPDIPRDSGFDEEFVQRKQEIAELKTGEAYVGYGRDTIKKVKMAYTSPQEMKDKYFIIIKNKYPEFSGMRPLVIGAKQRLSVISSLQGIRRTFIDEIKEIKGSRGNCAAVVGEDAYRMLPLRINFSQHENSSVLLLGSDKQIASSLCSSFALSLAKQNVPVYLFNGDRTKVQEEYESFVHSFMYVCQNAERLGENVKSYRLTEFAHIIGEMYAEYLRRQELYQKAEDEDPEFEPIFLIINDLFGIDAFSNNEMVENNNSSSSEQKGTGEEPFNLMNMDLDAAFADFSAPTKSSNSSIRENVQTIVSNLLKNGWRQNIHLILSIKGDPYTWRNSRVVSDTSNIILFNRTEYADQMENTYYLKEMLKNISNDGSDETMAIWFNRKAFSKIRPIIYDLSNQEELVAFDSMIKGE